MLLRFARTQVHPAGEGVPRAERLSTMLSLMLGVCMSSLDTAIANTALPTMAHDLATTESMSTKEIQKPPGADFWEWLQTADLKI